MRTIMAQMGHSDMKLKPQVLRSAGGRHTGREDRSYLGLSHVNGGIQKKSDMRPVSLCGFIGLSLAVEVAISGTIHFLHITASFGKRLSSWRRGRRGRGRRCGAFLVSDSITLSLQVRVELLFLAASYTGNCDSSIVRSRRLVASNSCHASLELKLL